MNPHKIGEQFHSSNNNYASNYAESPSYLGNLAESLEDQSNSLEPSGNNLGDRQHHTSHDQVSRFTKYADDGPMSKTQVFDDRHELNEISKIIPEYALQLNKHDTTHQQTVAVEETNHAGWTPADHTRQSVSTNVNQHNITSIPYDRDFDSSLMNYGNVMTHTVPQEQVVDPSKWSTTDRYLTSPVRSVGENQEYERYLAAQNQPEEALDGQTPSTSSAISKEPAIKKIDDENDEENCPFGDLPTHDDDIVPFDKIQCEGFSLRPVSGAAETRFVQQDVSPAKFQAVREREPFVEEHHSPVVKGLPQPVSKSKQSQNYRHVTCDNIGITHQIPVEEEYLFYPRLSPKNVPYCDQFKVTKSFVQKLGERHYRCLYPGCLTQTTNEENLRCHIEDVHFDIKYRCPDPDCTSVHGWYKNMIDKHGKSHKEIVFKAGKKFKSHMSDHYGPPFLVTKLAPKVINGKRSGRGCQSYGDAKRPRGVSI